MHIDIFLQKYLHDCIINSYDLIIANLIDVNYNHKLPILITSDTDVSLMTETEPLDRLLSKDLESFLEVVLVTSFFFNWGSRRTCLLPQKYIVFSDVPATVKVSPHWTIWKIKGNLFRNLYVVIHAYIHCEKK